MVLVDLGLIDGNNFSAASVDALEAAINASCSAGDIKMTIATVAPTGWLLLNGATIVNFQGLYPQAWAVIPAIWKSGSNANLPNMASSFPIGQDGSHGIGGAGGANTHTLVANNVPLHTHPIDHDHPNVNVTGYTSDAVDHTYGGNGSHAHNPSPGAGGTAYVGNGGGTTANLTLGGGSYILSPGTDSQGRLHQHDYNINVDLPNFVAASGNNTTTGTAVDHTPKWVAMNFIMKVH